MSYIPTNRDRPREAASPGLATDSPILGIMKQKELERRVNPGRGDINSIGRWAKTDGTDQECHVAPSIPGINYAVSIEGRHAAHPHSHSLGANLSPHRRLRSNQPEYGGEPDSSVLRVSGEDIESSICILISDMLSTRRQWDPSGNHRHTAGYWVAYLIYPPTYSKVRVRDGAEGASRILRYRGIGSSDSPACARQPTVLPYYDYYVFPFLEKEFARPTDRWAHTYIRTSTS
ncbi:hypothetical protein F5Y06DRAFT_178121 [Hypoxylon sp. FL0890]|nr:hypothetical protein F5Y06DRAFT_178121 [Hypoxylon sp. FL0890]